MRAFDRSQAFTASVAFFPRTKVQLNMIPPIQKIKNSNKRRHEVVPGSIPMSIGVHSRQFELLTRTGVAGRFQFGSMKEPIKIRSDNHYTIQPTKR